MIPREWEKDLVGLQFDGVMMHTPIDVNGCKVGNIIMAILLLC